MFNTPLKDFAVVFGMFTAILVLMPVVRLLEAAERRQAVAGSKP